MEINKKIYYEIFKKNFQYPIVRTPIGDAIKMDAKNAFIYACVTGSGYLDNPVYPFRLTGLFKLFQSAREYKFVSGIFEQGYLRYTPFLECQRRDFLNNTDKYIIPVEFKSQIDLKKYLRQQIEVLKSEEFSHKDFIIQPIDMSKKGNGLENLMEYFACEIFKEQGFIVENQIPLGHSIGSPDFGAFKVEYSQKVLSQQLGISTGFHIFELAMLRVFKESYELVFDREKKVDKEQDVLVVGEAKTSTRQMTEQLNKYINTGYYDYAFEIHPSKDKPNKDQFGIITIDDDYKLICKASQEKLSLEANNRLDYIKWINNCIKYYLLANLTSEEFSDIYSTKNSTKILNEVTLSEFVNRLTLEEVTLIVKEHIYKSR